MRQDEPVAPSRQPSRPAPRRPRGRPSNPLLTVDGITAAAVRLLEERGQDGLTMAALARRLDVAPSALYNHVADKQDVLRAVQDHVNAGIDCSAFGVLPWDEALAAWARSYRDAYARHPALVPVMAVTPVRSAPHTVAMYERVSAGLTAAGWPGHLVTNVVVAVESFVLGSALDTQAPEDIFDPGDLAAAAPAFDAANRARPGGDTALAAFEVGLQALLTGLRVLRAPGSVPGEERRTP
ncbi:transcriptional regulator, TetR family [Kineococcus radiotolerans SRS30216 = ATCC BAA-149]|uniref:Transcriptional regulator, TetR family n=1 Tax=Kineococcus radiotolerans (strain ATCC BAA-149 / DSM 14245 / SRS30216) TaxID=266940 RepID=A6W686_KINRD|nr:transcriptional regulator, TetR family [Kineococcus radiotolerans SRS30216 = ATCC BAA-149]